jgi:hypothetical protein
MKDLLQRRISLEQAADICGVPVPWLRRAAGDRVTDDTLTVGEALVVARDYQRDETEEHRRMRRLAWHRDTH